VRRHPCSARAPASSSTASSPRPGRHCSTARYVDHRFAEILGELEPAAIVEDNVCRLPGDPRKRTALGADPLLQPARAEGSGAAAPFSRLPVEDHSGWEDFRAEYARQVGALQAEFSAFCVERLIDVLSRTSHRYVVSKGPQHDEYELADNMIGEEFLPQTSVLPHVDA
jgi:hypothetical protein